MKIVPTNVSRCIVNLRLNNMNRGLIEQEESLLAAHISRMISKESRQSEKEVGIRNVMEKILIYIVASWETLDQYLTKRII